MEESMIGKKVRYRDETWEVVHVTGERRVVIVRIGVDVKMGAIRVDPVAVMVNLDEDEIEEIPHELTAKEYAEKLKEYFGWIEGDALKYRPCKNKACSECVFHGPGVECMATLYTIDPEKALEMIREQEEKSKPKGKTYLQDFIEKHPNARVTEEDGLPYICVKNVYGVEAGSANNCAEAHCEKCWNEAMPEEDNGKG